MFVQPILADSREITKPEPFSTTMHVEARFAGGTIIVDTEHVEWLGETLVKLDIPTMMNPLVLRPHEARDLAAALLAVAAFIDEEAVR